MRSQPYPWSLHDGSWVRLTLHAPTLRVPLFVPSADMTAFPLSSCLM